ncbi:MAG: J domain-containing protein [Rickettsiales bacterium]
MQDIVPTQNRIQKLGFWFEQFTQDIYETYRPLFDWRHLLSSPYGSANQFQNYLDASIRESDVEVRRTIVCYALAALAAKLAQSDGSITPKKRKAYATIFSISGVSKEKMVSLFDAAANDKAPALQYARQLKTLEDNGEEIIAQTMKRLVRFSMIDTPLSEASFNFLVMAGDVFGYNVQTVSMMINELDGPSTGDAYALLKIEPNATLKQIQEAYRDRMRTIHPDRWGAIGKTQFLHLLFTAKAAEVNAAYRRLTGIKEVKH